MRALMEKQRWNNAELAERLKVAPPQISDWLNIGGTREPSDQKLIAMGNAAGYPDSLWFWERAGLNRETVLAAVREQVRLYKGNPRPGEVFAIPQYSISELRTLAQQDALPGHSDNRPALQISALHMARPDRTFCFEIPSNIPHPPRPFASGDIVLVDGSWQSLDSFLQPRVELAAVFFDPLPEFVLEPAQTAAQVAQYRKRIPIYDPNAPSERLLRKFEIESDSRSRKERSAAKADRMRAKKAQAEALEPRVLFGGIDFEFGSESREGASFINHPWRIVLRSGNFKVGLTSWMMPGILPQNCDLPKSLITEARILGAVIGWLKLSSQSGGKPGFDLCVSRTRSAKEASGL